MPNINLHNADCLPALKEMEDNQFDLAIVDPQTGQKEHGGKDRRAKSKHKKKSWDNERVSAEYFDQLFRVSKDQIIWQAIFYQDYINRPSRGWIIWDKKLYNSDFADCELAWTSFNRGAKIVTRSKNGGDTRKFKNQFSHPCQKPEELYRWQLRNYGFNEDGTRKTILDTHRGSDSLTRACWDLGFDLTGYEIDSEYHENGLALFNQHKAQGNLFQDPPKQVVEQLKIETK